MVEDGSGILPSLFMCQEDKDDDSTTVRDGGFDDQEIIATIAMTDLTNFVGNVGQPELDLQNVAS